MPERPVNLGSADPRSEELGLVEHRDDGGTPAVLLAGHRPPGVDVIADTGCGGGPVELLLEVLGVVPPVPTGR